MHEGIEATSWQGLLQVVVSQVGRGYHYMQTVRYPEQKRLKWTQIDKKLVEQFAAGLSKYQRARAKNKGIANFYLIRWEHLLVILHTDGERPPGVRFTGEKFTDLRRQGKELEIGQVLSLQIMLKAKVEVRLAPRVYKGMKEILFGLAKTGSVAKVRHELSKLNGLPGYADLNKQKKELARFARKQLMRHQAQACSTAFRMRLGKKTVKVFKERA